MTSVTRNSLDAVKLAPNGAPPAESTGKTLILPVLISLTASRVPAALNWTPGG
jgi:hypothetical protein